MKRLILSILVLLLAMTLAAQDDTTVTISPELAAQLDDLEATVEAIRGLEAEMPVERRFPTREEAIAFFQESINEELTEALVIESEQFYRAFDFVDADFDLESIYADLIASQVAGYYDAETDEMNTILLSGNELGDSLPTLERTIYAHEYAHALQDQYFDLETYLGDTEQEADRALAVLSLIEGDATFVMQEYTVRLAEEEPGAMLSLLTASLFIDTDLPEGTPPILETELTMPYLDGLTFVTVLFNQGGWGAVNAAYDDPPVSTEQILHPQKYLDREDPIEVKLDALDANQMGSSWAVAGDGTLGEFYLREYLATQLSSRDAANAAAGWGGDRYQLYYDQNADELAWILEIAWDSEDEAAEFNELYAAFADSRMEGNALDDECWEHPETQEALCIVVEEGGDTVITYGPDILAARALLQ